MTAYCLHQIFKHSQGRDIEVIVVSNSGEEGLQYLEPYKEKIKLVIYPENLLQSHGLAFDYALKYHVTNECFITLESDSFPTKDNWLNYYDNLIEQGYEMAGSKLKLSGGEYIHPAGAMYRLTNWLEAAEIVKSYKYNYNDNAIWKSEFKYHQMVDNRTQVESYRPIAESVFHQGMGFKDEHLNTYGNRNIESEKGIILKPTETQREYQRVGYEPAQWFCYFHYATNKKVYQIPTEIVWMENRINQQQEYTLTENGVKHLWGVTAYSGVSEESVKDITTAKQNKMTELYNSIQ